MTLLEWAVTYAENGIKVFPLKPKTKEPIFKGSLHQATCDIDQVTDWWTRYPDANIGIPMGKANNMCGLDIDFKDGASPTIIERLAPTYITKTPKGGLHAIYKYPEQGIKNNKKIETGVTVRADGYYFVVPGSIHPETNTAYEPENAPLWKQEPSDCPQWIIDHPGLTNGDLKKEDKKNTETKTGESKANGKIPVGSRHDALRAYASALRFDGKEHDDIFKALEIYNQHTLSEPVPESELKNLAHWAASTLHPNPKEPIELAEAYLKTTGKHYFHHHGIFYEYQGKKYLALNFSAMEIRVQNWMASQMEKIRKHVGKFKSQQIAKALISLIPQISDEEDLPLLNLNGHLKNARSMLPLQNGIFDVKAYIEGKDNFLFEHSKDFYCTYCLPFSYNAQADASEYDRVAFEILNSNLMKQAWEEMMGYHLYQPYNLEKFFFIQGEGQNGKSVLMQMLKGIIGDENYSSVPIQNLRSDSFMFYSTYGKLANIVSDADDIENNCEGILKQFVTREKVQFDIKFREPICAKPTALLTVVSNHLPKFNDKTDGIWRRMFLLKLNKKIPDDKINTKYINPDYWVESGNLSGIFNRALEGLKRISEKKNFTNIEEMVQEKEQIRLDQNPVLQFLNDYCDLGSDYKEAAKYVYTSYTKMCRENGNRPFSQNMFSRQLKIEARKRGKDITSSGMLREDNYHGRFLMGIQLNPAGKQLTFEYVEGERERVPF